MAAMSRKGSLLREVNAPASNPWRWKTITICTGASASTLQDIKVAESCGGYSFQDSGTSGSCVRNRFIYWRTYQDVLELVEESLDLSLSGNMVRYRFQDSPILPQVSIHEVAGQVVVLVATVASVHRLVFPHPSKLNRQAGFVLSEQNATSIFYDAALPDDSRNQFLLTPGGSISSHLLSAASCMCSDGHTLFALATNAGGIQLIKLPPLSVAGVVIQLELSCSSLMKKFWTGLVPSVMKGQYVPETAVSIQLLPLQGDVYIFTVCKDFRFRVWSSKLRECILVENLLDFTSEDFEDTANPPIYNVSGHVIKSVQGVNNAGVCVHLALNNKTRFIFLNPVSAGGKLSMELVHTVSRAPDEDLVDFVVTDDFLVSLWSTQAGDHIMLATQLTGRGDNQREWEPVIVVSPLDYVVVPAHRDARDVYLEKIFAPGYFSTQDILKALSVYKRCPVSNLEVDSLCTLASLKEDVTNAVDTEIRNSALDCELQEEAYTQLQTEQWEKFYSCCHQYKQIGEKPKGLFADPVTGLFGVIKKSTFSVLRPCDKTEELYLSPTFKMSLSEIDRSEFTPEDVTPAQFSDDLRLMCDCVRLVNSLIPQEASAMFAASAQSMDSPETLVERLYEMIGEEGGLRGLTNILVKMTNPVTVVEYLLYLMDLNAHTPMDWEPANERIGHQHFSGLFSGSLGVSFVCQSFQQMVALRFNFLRDILVVTTTLANTLRKETAVSRNMLGIVTRELVPKASGLLRCYKILGWASEAITSTNINSTLDFNLQQLTHLGIKDKMLQGGAIKFNIQPGYLVQSFLESAGGEQCRIHLSSLQAGNSRDVWRTNLCDMVHSLALLIWPAAEDTVFPEFLIRSCQYLCLQHYVHLLTPWCVWNESSRSFFLALAYLHFNEPLKAIKLFIKASDGVATENFLSHKLLQTDEVDHFKLQTLYYLKVMKQFEFYGLPDLVVSLATEAINKASHDDPELATLQSEVFRQHLELGHSQLAFSAMMNNPNHELKKSSLRQFLAVLCERGCLSDLVSFDYKDLEEEVVYILEKKARSVDVATHDYYSLLFSFFIYRQDYRKAGRVMFERGLRLAQEVPGLASLQQQAQCYLFTLNTLRLVKPEYAWIIKPSLRRDGGGGGDQKQHNKRYMDGQNKDRHDGCNQMEILELPDLERQYLMLDARLNLIRRQPDSGLQSGPMPSPQEMLSLLCSSGLYDMAVQLTKAFSLSAQPVLSSLALRCITLALGAASNNSTNTTTGNFYKSSESSACASWVWLCENAIPPCGAKELSPCDQAWALLQAYLDQLEDGSGLCHRCVAFTLLAQGFHPPTWLINSYKAVDVSSLLRVYLTFDLLVPASKLAIEYLDGVKDVLKGLDVPTFGLKRVIPPSPLCVWVPYTSLDQLLVALSGQDNPTYVNMYQKLKKTITDYQNKTAEVSQQLPEY